MGRFLYPFLNQAPGGVSGAIGAFAFTLKMIAATDVTARIASTTWFDVKSCGSQPNALKHANKVPMMPAHTVLDCHQTISLLSINYSSVQGYLVMTRS